MGVRFRAMRVAAPCLFAIAVVGVARAASATAVPLTLSNPTDISVPQAPVHVGVPLPRGAWRDGSSVVAVDGDRSTPVQARVLSRWPDGSARWLLTDWQASLGAGESRRVRLEVGGKPVPPATTSLRASVDETGVRVETGVARFEIPRSGDVLLKTNSTSGGTGAAVRGFAVLDGKRYASEGTREIEVAESGPWRVRVNVRGAYGPLQYFLRLDFYAGDDGLHVLHTVENHGDAAAVSLQEMALVLTPAKAPERLAYTTASGGELFLDVPEDGGVRIVQEDADRLRVGSKASPGRAEGWFAAGSETATTAFVARYFWQEYPQSVTVVGKEITYHLVAPVADGSVVAFGSGAAKTHEIWLLPEGTPAEARELRGKRMAGLAWIDPAYVRQTGALRNALAASSMTSTFLDRLRASTAAYERAQDTEEWDDSGKATCSDGVGRRRVGAYGMFHWGDWNFRGYRDDVKGCDAWGNLEYDTAQVLGLAWVALGDPRLFEQMTAAARHFADVDTIHSSARHPRWVGMNHPKNPMHFTFELGGVDLGHTWVEGLLTYGLLTGDDRVLNTALGIADYLVQRRTSGVGFRGNPRQWGWPQVALVAAWEYSGKEKYREAALWYGQRGAAAHRADDLRQWKTGILAEGVAYTHSITDDPTLRAWLVAYAKAVAERQPKDARFYPALAYVGAITANEDWKRLARGAVDRLELGRWGKPMTIGGRIGLSTLNWLDPPSRASH